MQLNKINILLFILAFCSYKTTITSEETKINTEKQWELNYDLTQGNYDLIQGIRHANYEQVQKAISEGADVNHFSKDRSILSGISYYGNTPLQQSPNNIELIKLLIDSGADVNSKSINDGETALMIFSERFQKGDLMEIIKLLMEKGADINVKSFNDDTALSILAGRGFANEVNLLLSHGADIDTIIDAIKSAESNGHKEIADSLKEYVKKFEKEIGEVPLISDLINIVKGYSIPKETSSAEPKSAKKRGQILADAEMERQFSYLRNEEDEYNRLYEQNED